MILSSISMKFIPPFFPVRFRISIIELSQKTRKKSSFLCDNCVTICDNCVTKIRVLVVYDIVVIGGAPGLIHVLMSRTGRSPFGAPLYKYTVKKCIFF